VNRPGISRRQLIKAAGTGLASSFIIGGLKQNHLDWAIASESDRRFLLYIHCGSWDGIAAGLLQPNNTSSWPRGCLVRNQEAPAVNPLLNQFSQVGPHIFHRYNRVLERVSANLFHATVTAPSLDHAVAVHIASKGFQLGNPSWASGFAQRTKRGADPVALVVGLDGTPSNTIQQVAFAEARNLAAFRNRVSEPVTVSAGLPADAKNIFLNAAVSAYREHFGGAVMPIQYESTYVKAATNWAQGFPELSDSSPIVLSVSEAMKRQRTDELIATYLGDANDGAQTRARYNGYQSLRDQLILAGSLAKSGAASAMQIFLENEDLHFGGSEFETARSGAQVFTQLTQFWEWIKAQGMENQVMVVVSHEFTRTPYNNSKTLVNGFVDNKAVALDLPGKDHGLCAGVWVLHGKVPATRFGGIIPGYAAGGASELGGVIDSTKPPPGMIQVMGSLLMRCFPDEFVRSDQPNSGRLVKSIWPAFDEAKDIISCIRS
jgi:hypothetical protein